MHHCGGEASTFILTRLLLCMYSCATNQPKPALHMWKSQTSPLTMQLLRMQQGLLDSACRERALKYCILIGKASSRHILGNIKQYKLHLFLEAAVLRHACHMAEQRRVEDYEHCNLSTHHVTKSGQLYMHAIGCIRPHRVTHVVSHLQWG